MPADRLAQTFEELAAAGKLIFDNDTFEKGMAFQPSPGDVIISPWNKSGTTWLQQIVQGLRSGGVLDYDDVSQVIPWIDAAAALGQDLYAEQRWRPRAFKSHFSYRDVPKGARYIVSVREPNSVLVSNYRFNEGWFFEPGSFSINEYAPRWQKRSHGQDYWTHLASWWEQRHNDYVLLMAYEHMTSDHPGTVRRVAKFIGIDLDDDLFDTVVRQSSREFMLANKHLFDDKLIRDKATATGALPADNSGSKVTDGTFDPGYYAFSQETAHVMDREWAASMAEPFGLNSYGDLLTALAAEGTA